jgi:2-polyprenyl-3-methyl-5-hydroxy-6-metoxy-1,4-benzoquinol methylase
MQCRICENTSEFFSDAEILFKYKIKYYKCPNCGFVQTEEPYWLDEAYSDAINHSDIGLLKRNSDLVCPTANVISKFFDSSKKFLDYGAGYGVFVRMMRDRGYDFYWQDKYCDNLYAKDFTVKEKENYEVLTAYEVFEHLPDPVKEFGEMLKYSDNILFSTYIIPSDNPKPQDWWYFALDHGQHVSLYTEKSLSLLAKKFNMNLFSNGKNIHLITKRKISGLVFKILTKPYISDTLSVFFKKKSLLDSDYKKVLSNLKSGGA